jgi:hypothetical protein
MGREQVLLEQVALHEPTGRKMGTEKSADIFLPPFFCLLPGKFMVTMRVKNEMEPSHERALRSRRRKEADRIESTEIRLLTSAATAFKAGEQGQMEQVALHEPFHRNAAFRLLRRRSRGARFMVSFLNSTAVGFMGWGGGASTTE